MTVRVSRPGMFLYEVEGRRVRREGEGRGGGGCRLRGRRGGRRGGGGCGGCRWCGAGGCSGGNGSGGGGRRRQGPHGYPGESQRQRRLGLLLCKQTGPRHSLARSSEAVAVKYQEIIHVAETRANRGYTQQHTHRQKETAKTSHEGARQGRNHDPALYNYYSKNDSIAYVIRLMLH